MTDDERTPLYPAISGPDARALRARAAKYARWFPGAGFALLGYGGLAIVPFFAWLGIFGGMLWLAIQPSAEGLWTLAGATILGVVFSVGERLAVKRLTPRVPQPCFPFIGFIVAGALIWLAEAIVLVLFVVSFGSFRLAGGGMSPTLENGELVLYDKRVDRTRLGRGIVVIYNLSDRAALGIRRLHHVSRILGVPGDKLSIRGGRYLINGEPGAVVAGTGLCAPVLQVPAAPDTLTVPEGCYFVGPESPQDGLDSRVLSWLEAHNVVSTQLYYVNSRGVLGVLKPVN
jgi:signal peptidase I